MKVFKYPLQQVQPNMVGVINLLEGTRIINFDMHNGVPCIWCTVPFDPVVVHQEMQLPPDTEWADFPLKYCIVGTGHEVPAVTPHHVKSIMDDPYVWHLFTSEVPG